VSKDLSTIKENGKDGEVAIGGRLCMLVLNYSVLSLLKINCVGTYNKDANLAMLEN
jgi:hypothetical protein